MESLRAGDPGQIGPFRLIARLGAGGMGVVYLGRSDDGRYGAVKVIHDAVAGDARFRARFAREIETASSVRAPWVARTIAADAHAPQPWLAAEYLPGPSLTEAVHSGGPLPPAAAAVLVHRLAAALSALHAAGLVHRDIKPSNVILTADGPFLIDFGIAQSVDATAITTTGVIVGTPGFMSPEQARADTVGPPTDVFSLAGVLVFAATGRHPFGTASSPIVVLRKILDDEPDLSGLDAQLAATLRPCLAKDPAARPGAAEIEAATASWPAVTDPAGWPPPGLVERPVPEETLITPQPTTRLAPGGGRPRTRFRRGPVLAVGSLTAVSLAVVTGLLLGSGVFASAPSPAGGADPGGPAPARPAATSVAPEPDWPTTPDELFARMFARTRAEGGGRFQQTDTNSPDDPATSEGSFRYDGDAVTLRTEDRFLGHPFSSLLVDGQGWVRLAEGFNLPPGKSWLECPPERRGPGGKVPLSYCMRLMHAQEHADPAGYLRRAGRAVTVAESKADTFQGVRAIHYRLSIDWVAVAAQETDPDRRRWLDWEADSRGRETVNLWVDEQFRPLQLAVPAKSPSYRNGDVVVYQWGDRPEITPPPAGDVARM